MDIWVKFHGRIFVSTVLLLLAVQPAHGSNSKFGFRTELLDALGLNCSRDLRDAYPYAFQTMPNATLAELQAFFDRKDYSSKELRAWPERLANDSAEKHFFIEYLLNRFGSWEAFWQRAGNDTLKAFLQEYLLFRLEATELILSFEDQYDFGFSCFEAAHRSWSTWIRMFQLLEFMGSRDLSFPLDAAGSPLYVIDSNLLDQKASVEAALSYLAQIYLGKNARLMIATEQLFEVNGRIRKMLRADTPFVVSPLSSTQIDRSPSEAKADLAEIEDFIMRKRLEIFEDPDPRPDPDDRILAQSLFSGAKLLITADKRMAGTLSRHPEYIDASSTFYFGGHVYKVLSLRFPIDQTEYTLKLLDLTQVTVAATGEAVPYTKLISELKKFQSSP